MADSKDLSRSTGKGDARAQESSSEPVRRTRCTCSMVISRSVMPAC